MRIPLFLFVSLLLTVAGSCKSSQKDIDLTNKQVATNDTIPDTHTAAQSLDWAGTYTGTLPCADCEGILTSLTLNEDLTYLLKTRYQNKGEAPGIEKMGHFEWASDGKTILLQGLDNTPNRYTVGENMIIQLDMEGKPITGDLATKYILLKL